MRRRWGRRRGSCGDAEDAFAMKITAIEPFVCDGGLREFGFLKVTTDEGITGWAETYDWHTSASLATALAGHGPEAHRRGPAPDRADERADLVRRPARRPGADEGPRRDRHRAVGHQGEVAGRAGLRAARRPVPRPDPAVLVALRDLPGDLARGRRPASRRSPTRSGRAAPATSSPAATRCSRRTSSPRAGRDGERADAADATRRRDRPRARSTRR